MIPSPKVTKAIASHCLPACIGAREHVQYMCECIASRCHPSLSQWWLPARKLPKPLHPIASQHAEVRVNMCRTCACVLPPVASRASPNGDSQPESYHIHSPPLPPELVPMVIPSSKVTKAMASHGLPWPPAVPLVIPNPKVTKAFPPVASRA